jgi:CubicO group peptidase (beta-lactamase class C family)
LSKQLQRRLDGNCIGYGYVICNKDQVVTFGSGGFERLSQDAPEKAFSVFDRMNPASLGKTVTAICLLHALDKQGIPVTEYVYKYLPASWTCGTIARSITFEELLSHRSGIRFPAIDMDYAGLRNYLVDSGINEADKAEQQYDNANFWLMRILIPIIDGQTISGTDAQQATAYGLALERYANTNIFTKLGIPYVEFKPETENQNLCYQFPANGANGGDFGDWTTIGGGAGYHISPIQYAQMVRATFFSETIVPSEVAKSMRDNVWGFDFFWAGNTPFFNEPYVAKNGGFPGAQNPGEFNGQFCLFDNDVSVILYVNSQFNYPGGVGQVILDAFDASRK